MQQWQPRQSRPRRYRTKSRLRVFRRGRLPALLLFGLISLIGYGGDWLAARNTSGELQAVYRDAPADEPAPRTDPPAPAREGHEETAPPAVSPVPAAAPSPAPGPEDSPSPAPHLETMAYPNNPGLNMGGLLDEPVVQRDDTFYLTHDARGEENRNGAIFLEASVSIQTRPYTYILYGHNMKTGAMFGSLRNYENRKFYHTDPFITFDTVYEDGRYVIFAAGSISTEADSRHYVDFHDLKSADCERRQAALDALIAASVYTCPVDVRTDDQLLLLVTCTEKDQDRRVVAARRIRDGEDEAALRKTVGRSRKR